MALSITDGAPRTIELACGGRARIPSAMDYRIVAATREAVPEFDDIDGGVMLLYCALHATDKEIRKLWRDARSPRKLYESVQVWMAGVSADELASGLEEIQAYDDELSELAGDDDEGGDGKKKIGSP